MITANAVAFAAAVLLLFLLSRSRVLISSLAFAVLTAALALGLGAEVGGWLWRGIRAVEAGPEGLLVFRGAGRVRRWIGRGEVRAVRFTRRLGRRRIVVALRELPLPGGIIRIHRRLVLAEDAFRAEDFTLLMQAVERLQPETPKSKGGGASSAIRERPDGEAHLRRGRQEGRAPEGPDRQHPAGPPAP
jgi:hypothetical protein